MRNKLKPKRDAFTFSLGGLRAVSSVALAPAIPADGINKVIAERLARNPEEAPAESRVKRAKGRFRFPKLRRAT